MPRSRGQVLLFVITLLAVMVWFERQRTALPGPDEDRRPADVVDSDLADLAPVEGEKRVPEELPTEPDVAPGAGDAPEDEGPPPLACRVVRDGVGVPGCEVVLLKSKEVVHQDVTDAEGRFVLPRLEQMGSHNLEIRTGRATLRSKGLARRWKYNNGDDVRVFHLGYGAAEVTVFGGNGKPVADTRVVLSMRPDALDVRYSCAGRTDASGRVLFEDLPPGRVTISGICAAPNRRKATIPEGPVTVPVELGPAPDGIPLRVRVLAPDGSIVQSRVQVNCVALDSPGQESLTADRTSYPSGHHETRAPPGRYRITTYPELPGTPFETEHAADSPPVEIYVGGAVVRGLLGSYEPVLEGPIAHLSDSSMDAALYGTESTKPIATTRIRDAGTFEFLGVPPGRYVLSGTRGRLDPAMTEVEVVIASENEMVTVNGLALVK